MLKIRIKGDKRSYVAVIMDKLGVIPVRIIDREDGDVTFEVSSLPGNENIELLNSIPKEYFALQARVYD